MDSQTVFDIINHTSSLSIAIPLVCGIWRFKTLNAELRVLFIYILVSVATEVVAFIQTRNEVPTYLTYHMFTLLECSFLTYLYLSKFETKKTRVTIAIFYMFFLALAFIILVLKKNYNEQNNVLSTYEAAFLITLSAGYFVKLINDSNIPRLREFYFTWINTAVLIYFSMAFLLFLFEGYIENRGIKVYNNLFTLHWITNIAYNILLAIGIWKIRHK